ncbi:disease resistance protein RGA2-like [Telopea speciosissima]|uniref:disease resistance protein RGA2-like n=1 Tax=Telopea speciosissima TaxID=54955 RepID=UPI001CC3E2F1|nr:disease resistance protein RGA2-like [Telopea speciosissima]
MHFSSDKRLRVLQLRHVSKDDELLLSSIGDELMHLRYLDLSHGRFKALPPSISKLFHLQTLKLLLCTNLQTLPKGLRKLINLRHLEIETRLNIPRGLIRQLHNLRTLTSFKVGGHNNIIDDDDEGAAGIKELRCLQQLGGSLSLIGLGDVRNGADAKAANLKEKAKLQELTLDWESDWHVYTNEDDSSKEDDVVLEELQPHQNLLLLRILRFSGTKLPTWLHHHHHLSNLQELCNYSCHQVKSLDLTGSSSLWKLTISYCENLEYAGVEGLMQLELLEFKGCDKLKSLLGVGAKKKKGVVVNDQEEHHHHHHHQVAGCSSRETPAAITDDTGEKLVKLVKLQIQSYDSLTTLPKKEMLLLQSLRTLHIESCANPMVLTKGGLEKLSLLQHLQIENCPNLKKLPEGVGQLSSLQYFAIRECPKLMFLSEELEHWRSLRTMSIFACANLRALPRGIVELTSLQELEINRCDFLPSLPDEMQKLMSLQMLKIERCLHLVALPAGLGNLSLHEVSEISSCNGLMSLPAGGMQQQQQHYLRKLDRLKIKGCDNLEILPEDCLGKLSTLRVLAIIGCPNLQVLPESLGNLQNFHLLEITDCPNLKALPRGLGKLSSLRSLYIQRCLNLTSLFSDTPAAHDIFTGTLAD